MNFISDPNIPFNLKITPSIPYSDKPKCYAHCHLNNLTEIHQHNHYVDSNNNSDHVDDDGQCFNIQLSDDDDDDVGQDHHDQSFENNEKSTTSLHSQKN